MHRPGCNPDDLRMSDVLCDFCHREWTDQRPMVEGHRGSCICGACLEVAYTQLMAPREELAGEQTAAPPPSTALRRTCVLCLEEHPPPFWESPLNPEALACRRCVRQSAAVLQKDPDSHWRRPEV